MPKIILPFEGSPEGFTEEVARELKEPVFSVGGTPPKGFTVEDVIEYLRKSWWHHHNRPLPPGEIADPNAYEDAKAAGIITEIPQGTEQ